MKCVGLSVLFYISVLCAYSQISDDVRCLQNNMDTDYEIWCIYESLVYAETTQKENSHFWVHELLFTQGLK